MAHGPERAVSDPRRVRHRLTSFLDTHAGRDHVPGMTPEIRMVILDTTGPTARLVVENWPRERALALHGLLGTKKPATGQTGRAKQAALVRG